MKNISRYKPRRVQTFEWSPKLAYVVGLIVTDGCLSSDLRNIAFTSKDIEQIGNLIRILKLKNKIGFTRNKKSEAYRINISNVQFYDWLLKIGLTSNKSLTLGKIKIPDKYFVDFLRGHLDGDGSINTYIDKYNAKKNPEYIYERIFVTFISASKNHILWLHNKIMKIVGVKGAIHVSKVKNDFQNPMYIIKFGKKESLKLLGKIYYSESLLCLSRKRRKYLDFIKNLHRPVKATVE
jgi:hypothetical protein